MALTKDEAVDYILRKIQDEGADVSNPHLLVGYVVSLFQKHIPINVLDGIKSELDTKINSEKAQQKQGIRDQLVQLGVDPKTKLEDI